jgi:hypothetical protein
MTSQPLHRAQCWRPARFGVPHCGQLTALWAISCENARPQKPQTTSWPLSGAPQFVHVELISPS